jgi:catechol 2,3-dioxygenase-like lactoylglutathione lyase family enzyme
MERSDLPVPTTGVLATHFVVARDLETTTRFYSDVLGGEVVFDGTRIGPGVPNYASSQHLISPTLRWSDPTSPDHPRCPR